MLKVTNKWPFSNKTLSIFTLLGLLISVFFFYVWHLGTLTPGFSQAEIDARNSSASLGQLLNNPVYAPQRLIQFIFQYLGQNGAFWMRLASVMVALALLYFFFLLLRLWFGKFISILTTLMLAGTPLVILLARSAGPEILLLSPIALLACFVWLCRSDRKSVAWLSLVILTVLSFYVPGLLLFTIIASAIYFRPLMKAYRSVRPSIRIISLAVALILLAPLVVALARDPTIYSQFIPLPRPWPTAQEAMKSLGQSLMGLVWRTEGGHPLILGRLPVLNAIQLVIIMFGIFAMWSRARRELLLITSTIALGVLAAGLTNDILYLALALPALGILAAAGFRYLYKEWRDVFPLNPLPRALAILLMSSIVVLHLFIGGRYALVAWPYTVATKSAYVLK